MTVVSVVGAGRMGLPLACLFARRGATVLACDIDPGVVQAINEACSPTDEPGVQELLAQAVASGRLQATTETVAAVRRSEVVVVVVPALLTAEREADCSILASVSRQIASGMQPGLLVSFETAVPVGTTRHVLTPLLEGNGLHAGRDFAVAFSPGRVTSGRALSRLSVTPKVVGGWDEAAAARALDFYATYLGAPVQNVGSLEAAELVKLAGVVHRDVNIAVANELARYAEAVGLDLPALLGPINSDGEAALPAPGIGVGGPGTQAYPYFLFPDAERRGVPVTLAERARRVNDGQAHHVLDRLEERLGTLAGLRVVILGLAVRPGVKEDSQSAAYLLRDELVRRRARVELHDPLFTAEEMRVRGFDPGGFAGAEVIVLNTPHEVYGELDFPELARGGLRAVVDGPQLWTADAVRCAGVLYLGVGRPLPPRAESAPLPITRPSLGGWAAEAAADVVRSGWVLQGPQVAAFEEEFAAYVGAPHACAVSSGTAALHLALLAAGVGPGDEVITVSHSYVATANCIVHCGGRPVFVDIERGSLNIDPRQVEAAITPRTRAILCVHQLGMPCDLAAIVALGRARGLPVVEDAACAAGSEILWDGRWERIGRPHGDAACFSFHPRKLLTTGDGGIVTTRHAGWDARVRRLRQHGLVSGPAGDSFPEVGYNYRLTDVQAAMARAQLQRFDALVRDRRAVAARYREALAELEGVELQAEPTWARSNWQSVCVRLPAGTDRVRVVETLAARGIASRPGVMNAHEEPAYRAAGATLPESESARRMCLMLPCSHDLSARDVKRVIEALGTGLREAEAARPRP